MKAIYTFLGIIVVANAAHVAVKAPGVSDRGVDDVATDLIYKLQDQMPCGFPDLGIPPLAPLKIPYKAVNIDLPDFKFAGAVQDFRIDGLNKFDINNIDINVITSKMAVELNFGDISVETLFDMHSYMKLGGLTINLLGDGPAKFALKNLNIAFDLKYNLNALKGTLQVKTFNLRTQIGQVNSNIKGVLGDGRINERLNTLIQNLVELVLNGNGEVINELIANRILPNVNAKIANVSIFDVVASVGSADSAPCEA